MGDVASPGHQDNYLTRILGLLWPHQAGDSCEGKRPAMMIALPSRRRPKLIIPRRPRRVAAAALRNYRASARGVDKVMLRLGATGTAVGLLDLFPGRLTMNISDAAIDTHLSWLLGVQVRVALYIGPPRAVQKPVLQVIDRNGRTVAFAKLATNQLTRSLVRREAETIGMLHKSELESIRVPQLLEHSTWEATELTVQKAIPPGGSALRLRRLLPRATNEVARCRGVVSEPWSDSAYRRRLRSRLEHVEQSESSATIQEGIELADNVIGDSPLEFGCWHGDWSPWNMTARGQMVVAWDWEHFEFGIPIGFDAIHYDVAYLTMSGQAPKDALSAVLNCPERYLTAAVCGPRWGPILVLLYALELGSRYLADGEDQFAGTAMSELDKWLPSIVAECRDVARYDA